MSARPTTAASTVITGLIAAPLFACWAGNEGLGLPEEAAAPVPEAEVYVTVPLLSPVGYGAGATLVEASPVGSAIEE